MHQWSKYSRYPYFSKTVTLASTASCIVWIAVFVQQVGKDPAYWIGSLEIVLHVPRKIGWKIGAERALSAHATGSWLCPALPLCSRVWYLDKRVLSASSVWNVHMQSLWRHSSGLTLEKWLCYSLQCLISSVLVVKFAEHNLQCQVLLGEAPWKHKFHFYTNSRIQQIL